MEQPSEHSSFPFIRDVFSFVALFKIRLVGPCQGGVDGKVAVTQVPTFTQHPVAVEADQELRLHLDVVGRVGVVGADHRIAEIP